MDLQKELKQAIYDKYRTDEYHVRDLQEDDYKLGFFETYENLTVSPKLNKEQFVGILNSQNKNTDILKYIQIAVVETKTNRVVGFGCNIVETQLSDKQGFIENIVVNKTFAGRGLGKKIILILLELANKLERTHKISLNCKPKNVAFYNIFDFKTEGIFIEQKL